MTTTITTTTQTPVQYTARLPFEERLQHLVQMLREHRVEEALVARISHLQESSESARQIAYIYFSCDFAETKALDLIQDLVAESEVDDFLAEYAQEFHEIQELLAAQKTHDESLKVLDEKSAEVCSTAMKAYHQIHDELVTIQTNREDQREQNEATVQRIFSRIEVDMHKIEQLAKNLDQIKNKETQTLDSSNAALKKLSTLLEKGSP